MSSTENSYSETDLGNVSPNPRGEYDPETSYEYLDLVNYEGGSYLCLAELGTTVTGVAPAHGKNTETWQLLTLPGDLTPECGDCGGTTKERYLEILEFTHFVEFFSFNKIGENHKEKILVQRVTVVVALDLGTGNTKNLEYENE